MNFINNIIEWYKDLQEDIIDAFSPGGLQENIGEERQFPSMVSALFRLFVKYFHYVLPVLWVIILILCIVEKLPFIGVILTSIIATALAAVLLVLVFFILMVLESFSKAIAGLILNGDIPEGDENPIDCFILLMLRGDGN